MLSIITGAGNKKPDCKLLLGKDKLRSNMIGRKAKMPDIDFKNIAQIIGGMNCKVSNLAKKSQSINNLNSLLDQHLPNNLIGQIKAYDFYQGILKISVTNASIATQIRNSSTSLIAKLNNTLSFNHILSLQCKIHTKPKTQNLANKNNTATAISSSSREKLSKLSGIIKDKNLADALEKLSKK